MARRWKGVLAIEGQMTGDGRVIAENALTWSDLPLPLAWLQQSQHGDGMGNPGAVDLGNIDQLDRDGQDIAGGGVIDDGSEHGGEFVRKLDDGTAPLGDRWGLSVDLDDLVMEIVDTDPQPADGEDGVDPTLIASGARGHVLATYRGDTARRAWALDRAQLALIAGALVAAAGDPVPDGAVVVDAWDPNRFVMRLTSGRIRGVTACPVAAFDGAFLELDGETQADPEDAPGDQAEPDAVVAAGGPLKPPSAWLSDDDAPTDDTDPRLVPQYDLTTGAFIGFAVPLTITDDGRIFGQLAPANRCHSAHSVCVTPPDSMQAYSHFHVGSLVCDDGTEHATGSLLIGCDHAPLSMTMAQARDHYANTGLAFADVRVYANKYGPWVTGALRPDVTEELKRTIRGGGISGDWRGDRNHLELMAIQAVPVPGFTVQRVRPLAASASTVEVAPWAPMVQVDGELVQVSTMPVQPLVAASSCGCGGQGHAQADESAMLLRQLLNEVASLRADVRAVKLRTQPMHAQAVGMVASAIRDGRGR